MTEKSARISQEKESIPFKNELSNPNSSIIISNKVYPFEQFKPDLTMENSTISPQNQIFYPSPNNPEVYSLNMYQEQESKNTLSINKLDYQQNYNFANPISNNTFIQPQLQNESDNKQLSFSQRLSSFRTFYNNRMITDNNDRNNFIRKVYGILLSQILFTAVIVSMLVGIKNTREVIKKSYYASLGCIIFALIFGYFILVKREMLKKYPQNYVCLYLFTIIISYPIAYYSSRHSFIGVASSLFVTLGITGALAVAAYFTKGKFTLIRGFAVGLTSGCSFFALSLSFSFTNIVAVSIGMAFVFIFTIYIVWDLQMICGGRYHELTYDDYALGALLLYIDIIALFLYLMGTKK
ncbi:hypothetical protein SteCoe_19323 [Stentor coeruleus]|uniref:Uncharacterized protein n=1 Tax=Stentor coeruleus TaxID=5963 RepID=A0A1R2BUI2_9CILI|nr:hypothetical protein SteCoe_19323 [Stentor coeruleus]